MTSNGMTLAEQTTRRLLLAGITYDDPGLVAIREWNAAAYKRREAGVNQQATAQAGHPASRAQSTECERSGLGDGCDGW